MPGEPAAVAAFCPKTAHQPAHNLPKWRGDAASADSTHGPAPSPNVGSTERRTGTATADRRQLGQSGDETGPPKPREAAERSADQRSWTTANHGRRRSRGRRRPRTEAASHNAEIPNTIRRQRKNYRRSTCRDRRCKPPRRAKQAHSPQHKGETRSRSRGQLTAARGPQHNHSRKEGDRNTGIDYDPWDTSDTNHTPTQQTQGPHHDPRYHHYQHQPPQPPHPLRTELATRHRPLARERQPCTRRDSATLPGTTVPTHSTKAPPTTTTSKADQLQHGPASKPTTAGQRRPGPRHHKATAAPTEKYRGQPNTGGPAAGNQHPQHRRTQPSCSEQPRHRPRDEPVPNATSRNQSQATATTADADQQQHTHVAASSRRQHWHQRGRQPAGADSARSLPLRHDRPAARRLGRKRGRRGTSRRGEPSRRGETQSTAAADSKHEGGGEQRTRNKREKAALKAWLRRHGYTWGWQDDVTRRSSQPPRAGRQSNHQPQRPQPTAAAARGGATPKQRARDHTASATFVVGRSAQPPPATVARPHTSN